MKSVTNSIFKTFLLSVLVVAQVHFAYAQTASILPPAKTTFLDANGKPLTAGTVESYIPSTSTHKTTWQDAAETIPNANPLILDAAGRALLLGSGSYRQVVKDRLNNVIWDQVTSSTGSGGGGSGTIATGDGDLVGTIKPWAGMTAPNQYVFTYGQEVSRVTFATLFTAITSAQSIFCNSGSPILNGLSDTNNFWIGSTVELSCLGAGFSTIISKTATTVTLAANANVTTGTIATFFPWGRGNGTTTFNIPDFRGFAIAGNNTMGGTPSANLTTTFFGSQDPNSSGAAGGSQSLTLTASQLPTNIPNSAVTVISGGTFGGTVNSPNIQTGGGLSAPTSTNAIGATTTVTINPSGGVSTATVAAGGSGYTAGTQTLTVSGGTCTTAAQFSVTVVAGAITAPVQVVAPVCTIVPSNPAATTGGGGTGGTLNISYAALPFSKIQPTKTSNYIIKVTPDDNSATASGVTALGSMTGSIACGSGLLCTGNNISVSNITFAQTANSGGVLASTCAASGWFNSLGNGTGVFNCVQPAFTDVSGIATLAQGGTNANLTANNGGIFWSNATQAQILAGTATARLPLLSGATATPVWGAFTLPASATSGGVLCFTSTTVSASSVLQTANAIMLGGGAGVCPSPMASLGTTTTVLHGNAAGAPTFGAVAFSTDVSGLGTGVATAAAVNTGSAGALTVLIARGTSALGTGAITSATCATVVTTAATNTATTDVVTASFNGDPTAVTGYIPSTAGMLTIFAYPTVNNVNFKVCNNTAGSITPGAITLNWRVDR